MAERKFEECWFPEALKLYQINRDIFGIASRAVVKKVFDEYVPLDKKILEIGSGLGELASILPDHQLQETDQSAEIVAENKNLNPSSNITQANVYSLPFDNQSFDVVAGYCTFDTFGHPEKALAEMSRVLVPQGLLIHLQDLKSNTNVVFAKYHQSGQVAFPAMDGEDNRAGVRLVSEDKLRTMISQGYQPELKQLFEKYMEHPEKINSFFSHHPDYQHFIPILAKTVAEDFPDAEVVKYNDFFLKNITAALSQDFEIVELGNRTASDYVKRAGAYELFPQFNLIKNDCGFDNADQDSNLASILASTGYDLKIESTLPVIVARKK